MPSLFTTPIHLGLGASARVQPDFTGMEWYEDYVTRTERDGGEGRLVSLSRFSESWTSWEMHPAGDEVVICTEGRMTLHQELPDGIRAVKLEKGDYAINPAGVWHTADVTEGEATALFITHGPGTQHRPR